MHATLGEGARLVQSSPLTPPRILAPMRTLFALVALMATIAFAGTRKQSDADGIKATIKDYIEGYYTGNADRVKSALHPMLAKRFVGKKKTGGEILVDGTAQHMVEMTAAQDGPKYYKKGQQRL